jgi:C1A family cysteine protease
VTAFAGRGLGWLKPERHVYANLRHAGLRASHVLAGIQPAGSADCSNLVKILDQGQLGSCTCNAIAQMIRAAMLFAGASTDTEFLSRLWAYTLALAANGNFGKDTGTYLATVMDELANYGFPKESRWPYDLATFGQKPSIDCWHDAHDQRTNMSIAYHQISEEGEARLTVIRQALTTGKLVAFGTPVTEAFCSSDPTDIVDRPESSDSIAGGHALTVCGYGQDARFGERYKIANSWGPDWGNSGFFWMSPAYLMWGETDDLWMVTKTPMFSQRDAMATSDHRIQDEGETL